MKIIYKNHLYDSERDRFSGKTEVNLKYGDKEKNKEEIIKMNQVLEHVRISYSQALHTAKTSYKQQ